MSSCKCQLLFLFLIVQSFSLLAQMNLMYNSGQSGTEFLSCPGIQYDKYVVTVQSRSSDLKIWDLSSSKLLATRRKHLLEITDVETLESKNLLITSSLDNTIRAEDFETGELKWVFGEAISDESFHKSKHSKPIRSIWKTKNEDYVIFLSTNIKNTVIGILNAGSGKLVKEIIFPYGSFDLFSEVSFFESGKNILIFEEYTGLLKINSEDFSYEMDNENDWRNQYVCAFYGDSVLFANKKGGEHSFIYEIGTGIEEFKQGNFIRSERLAEQSNRNSITDCFYDVSNFEEDSTIVAEEFKSDLKSKIVFNKHQFSYWLDSIYTIGSIIELNNNFIEVDFLNNSGKVSRMIFKLTNKGCNIDSFANFILADYQYQIEGEHIKIAIDSQDNIFELWIHHSGGILTKLLLIANEEFVLNDSSYIESDRNDAGGFALLPSRSFIDEKGIGLIFARKEIFVIDFLESTFYPFSLSNEINWSNPFYQKDICRGEGDFFGCVWQENFDEFSINYRLIENLGRDTLAQSVYINDVFQVCDFKFFSNDSSLFVLTSKGDTWNEIEYYFNIINISKSRKKTKNVIKVNFNDEISRFRKNRVFSFVGSGFSNHGDIFFIVEQGRENSLIHFFNVEGARYFRYIKTEIVEGKVSTFSLDEQKDLMAIGFDDRIVKLCRYSDSRVLLNLIAFQRDFFSVDVILKLENSPYYMCSNKESSKLLYYVTTELNVIGFDQLDPIYNRPDIVLEEIGKYFGNLNHDLITTYRAAYQKRIARLGINEKSIENKAIDLPLVEIENLNEISQSNSSGFIMPEVIADDKKYRLLSYNVYVNEVPVYGSSGFSLSELNTNHWEKIDTISLSEGLNRVQISVVNEIGLESMRFSLNVNYVPERAVECRTFFIGIGVNEFKDKGRNLKYCVKDVKDLAQTFLDIIPNVDTLLLTDSEVTRENVIALKHYLKQNTTINDQVIISCSSHGVLDDSLNFYLATSDIDFDNPMRRGLRYEELESLLDDIPARRKLLLLDACNSGENEKLFIERSKRNDLAELDPKKKGEELEAINDELSTFHKMNELFVNVRNQTGSVIISAAGGMQSALEAIQVNGKEIENGAFTYCIKERLTQSDSRLMLKELKEYVEVKVEQITNHQQKPTSRQETMEVDWVIKTDENVIDTRRI